MNSFFPKQCYQNCSHNFLPSFVNIYEHLRYGKQEGLTNTELKRVHDVGTRFQQKSLVSLHENVPQYEEAGPIIIFKFRVKNCANEILCLAIISHVSLYWICEEYLDENLATHHRQCAVCSPQWPVEAQPETSIHGHSKGTPFWLRLHPRMFGHPNSRARSWRICYHKDKKRWNSRYSLQDLAEILLADKSSNYTDVPELFFEQRNAHGEVSEEDLSKLLD